MHPQEKEQESLCVVYIIRMSDFHFITSCINTCPLLLRPLPCGEFVTLQSERMSKCVTFLYQTGFEVLVIRHRLLGAPLQQGNKQI